jgi:hypothetical protein
MSPSPSIELSPQLWNWWVGFYLTMGAMLSLAVALVVAVLIGHLLYRLARKIEMEPVPQSPGWASLKLSAFGALALGAVLIPVMISLIYSVLSNLLWSMAPAAVNAPPLDLGFASDDAQISGMSSLVLELLILAVLISGAIFLFFRKAARKINPHEGPPGLVMGLIRTYFHDSVLVGFLLCVIACPVILYFLYNAALLVLVVLPAARHALPKIAFPDAERIYLKGLTWLGSWLLLILLIPAAGLAGRAALLRLRYTIENPYLRQIFIRGLKFSLIGLLGWMGSTAMYFMADWIFKLILSLSV